MKSLNSRGSFGIGSLLSALVLTVAVLNSAVADQEVKEIRVSPKGIARFLGAAQYGLGVGQGWVASGAVFRCYFDATPADPSQGQNAGKEVLNSCFVSTIKAERKDSAALKQLKRESLAEKQVAKVVSSREDFALGFNNGQQEYGAIIRCYSPEGTGNPADRKYCTAVPISALKSL